MEARLTRSQQFQSSIFTPVSGGKLRKERVSQTYASTVFQGNVPERSRQVPTESSGNYARRKYQEGSSVLDGAIAQCANLPSSSEGEKGTVRPRKPAGKKENPSCDFDYKPRVTRMQTSSVFTLPGPGEEEIPVVRPRKQRSSERGNPRETHKTSLWIVGKGGQTSSVGSGSGVEPGTLELSSIPSGMTPMDVVRCCGNVQVVAVKLPADPITQVCQGSGRLQVRGNQAELRKTKIALLAAGISVKSL